MCFKLSIDIYANCRAPLTWKKELTDRAKYSTKKAVVLKYKRKIHTYAVFPVNK